MSIKKIAVVGSSNTDMIIKVPRLPRPSETVVGGKFSMAAGGKGANQAVAASRAGGNVVFIARIGEDFFGDRAVKSFVMDRIDVSYIIKDREAPSGIALIFVAEDGQNSIAVAPGANAKLSRNDIEKVAPVIASANILLMQLETPLESVQRSAEIAHEAGGIVILNPAPAVRVPAELLKNVSILTPNELEAEVMTGIQVSDEEAPNRTAAALLAQGVGTVLITLSARGAFLATESVREIVPGYQVKAVDSTGAGDVFNGALAVALCEGKPLRDAVSFANAAAALSVTKLGAQPSIPRRKEIDSFIASHTPNVKA